MHVQGEEGGSRMCRGGAIYARAGGGGRGEYYPMHMPACLAGPGVYTLIPRRSSPRPYAQDNVKFASQRAMRDRGMSGLEEARVRISNWWRGIAILRQEWQVRRAGGGRSGSM